MSFFGFQENNLEEERQRIRDGGSHENEDVAVYTWGEESYDGLGDALQEGGDDFNDETFGGAGNVGKDFDFAGQASLLEPGLTHQKAANHALPSPAQSRLDPSPAHPIEQQSIWDDRSPFSALPRENGGASRFAERGERREPSTSQFSPFPESPVLHQPNASQTGARTLQDIEAEMRAAALQSRGASQRQQNALRIQQEEEQFLQDQAYQRQRLAFQREREQERELQLQALQRLQQQQVMQLREQPQHQRTPPPRMLPVSQSPRFLDQRQMMLLQQQQEEQQHQLRLQQELQEQLRMEELERQLRAQQISQLNQGPTHFNHRRQPSGPTIAELQALQQQQLHRRQRSQSPAYQDFNNIAPQNVQLQQRLLAELAQVEYMRDFQGATQAEQDALRAEAMRKIVEAEKMEDKRRKKAAKIAHMSRYNDLMTQSDKDFITRIQVSQLVTPDPYADDFYAQVYGAILRSRMGLQTQDERVLKFGTGGGISLGNTQKAATRRPNAMQRMEQQVERIVSNARRREEEKGLHSLHSLQGALGKTSGRSYKAAPRQLLQVDDNPSTSPTLAHAHPHISKEDATAWSSEGAAKEAAKLSRETLGNTGNVVRKDPLTHRQVLTTLEALYDLVLKVEHLRREQPQPEEEDASRQWQKEYDDLIELLWEGLKVMVPLETSNPHPFVSLLSPSKGKKLLPRLTRHIGSARMLTLMTLLVACFTQLDVVRQAPLLDVLEETAERAEVERQTQAFLGSVLQSILPIVANLELHVVTALLGLLIDRSQDIAAVAKTKPGLALLTLFLSRVEVIKQAWGTGAEPVDLMTAGAALEQQAVFDQFFVLITPHFLSLFPSSRITLQAHHPTSAALAIDIIDQPVWQFLAALALQAVPEQHQVLVTSLRDKVLENVLSANKGWVADEDERRTKLANVNLFLHALGLDSSQIAL
ncbi:topoisomerase II-associated protein PAT1 [Mycena rosella]|uniref:Topoisomerase II-associated protein PAT1 n=1 Tax=Mycena rosella TaxID=1033263 RepID=A0AAD7D0F9_MYCRO|nr:topoisomerase II-associated protein PAT1 [Mycena rosella]